MTDVFLAIQENILVLREKCTDVLWDKVKQCHQLSSHGSEKVGVGKERGRTKQIQQN